MAKKLPKIVREIQNNPPTEVNFAYQKNISYSQMSIYRNCAHRWKLQYKDKIKRFTSSIHTVFGTAIHESIQSYLDTMYNTSTTVADQINMEDTFQANFINEYQKQYKANNGSHFSSAEEMREFYEDGVAILNWLKKRKARYFSKRGWSLVGCEILRFHVESRIKPLIHVFGHIHHAHGAVLQDDTMYVNASICTERYIPSNKPIVIDITEENGKFITTYVENY